MLGEIGGLGFIGLFLSVFATSDPDRGLGRIISTLSEEFLGEREILLETFESLHEYFFEVGIAFFTIMGTVVYAVITRINLLSEFSLKILDTNGDGEVSLDELADALNAEAVLVDLDGDGELSQEEINLAIQKTQIRNIFDEAFLTTEKRAAEILLIRQTFLEEHNLPQSFKIEKYFEEIFAHYLEEFVELSPLTWLPLIPLISLLDSIDLNREVVSGFSANSALSSGCFIATPWFLIPSLLSGVFSILWCFGNYWKIKTIKNMLIPTLVRDRQSGQARMLPPKYKSDTLRQELNTSPGLFFIIIETLLGGREKPKNDHEYLFGISGGDGPEIYCTSIKFHTWLCVAQAVLLLGQIVLPDMYALLDYNSGKLLATDIGNIDLLIPELSLYLGLVLLSLAQLYFTPSAFLNYCTATSIEEMTKEWALKKATKESLIEINE